MPTQKQTRSAKKKFGVFILLLLAAIASIWYFDLTKFLTPETIKSFIDGLGPWGAVAFIGIYAIASVFLLPGLPFTLAGGAIFGTFWGTIYVVIGATIGAMLSFLVARGLGEEFVENVLKGKFKQLSEYDDKIGENGLSVILLLRLIPIFPFNVVNFGMGLTNMTFRDYAIGTFFGIIPGTFAYAYFGSSLANLSITNIVGAVLAIAALSAIGIIYKKRQDQKCKDPSTSPNTELSKED